MSEINLQSGVSASLELPPRTRAMVIFAHGSGSSRFSPRNRFVAHQLNNAGFGTLLFDMLTPNEDARDTALRFDIGLLSSRLEEALVWWRAEAEARLPEPVLDWNLDAFAQLPAGSGSRIEVVPGATHLFEEAGRWSRWLTWRWAGSGCTLRERSDRQKRTENAS